MRQSTIDVSEEARQYVTGIHRLERPEQTWSWIAPLLPALVLLAGLLWTRPVRSVRAQVLAALGQGSARSASAASRPASPPGIG